MALASRVVVEPCSKSLRAPGELGRRAFFMLSRVRPTDLAMELHRSRRWYSWEATCSARLLGADFPLAMTARCLRLFRKAERARRNDRAKLVGTGRFELPT